MLVEDKTLCHRVVNGRQQGRVIIAEVQQANRFFMCAGLRPGDGLEQLVEGAVTAGQCDEPI